jgi:hypothetical protein
MILEFTPHVIVRTLRMAVESSVELGAILQLCPAYYIPQHPGLAR